jgi:hypothetical protein
VRHAVLVTLLLVTDTIGVGPGRTGDSWPADRFCRQIQSFQPDTAGRTTRQPHTRPSLPVCPSWRSDGLRSAQASFCSTGRQHSHADMICGRFAQVSSRAAVPNRSMNLAGASEFAGTGIEWLLHREADGRSGRCFVVCSLDDVVKFVGVTGKGAS